MKYTEIKTSCRTFMQGDGELGLIHVHKIREDEYLVLHEDAYGLQTGKVQFLNEADLEAKFGRILNKFRAGDSVKLTNDCFYKSGYPDNKDFYVKELLPPSPAEYHYNIVVANASFGADWVEFFNEDELILCI